MRKYLKFGHEEIDKIIPGILEEYEAMWEGLIENQNKEEKNNFSYTKELIENIIINYAENTIAEYLEQNLICEDYDLSLMKDDLHTSLLLFPQILLHVKNQKVEELNKIENVIRDHKRKISERNRENRKLKKKDKSYLLYREILREIRASKVSLYRATKTICREKGISNEFQRIFENVRQYFNYNKIPYPRYRGKRELRNKK